MGPFITTHHTQHAKIATVLLPMVKKRPTRRFPGKKNVHGKEKAAKSGLTSSSDDWISALAKSSAASDAVVSSVPFAKSSKAERIEKRAAKKRRREERKQRPEVATVRNEEFNEDERDSSMRPMSRRRKQHRRSRDCLNKLSSVLYECTSASDRESGAYQVPYRPSESAKKGKATSGNQLDEDRVQPQPRDYGGLGLARPSLLISLRDPSFVPRLEEEFAEHIPGFFGKQRTKAMKRQIDGNMLWRRLAEKRTGNQKLGGKQLSDMSPDDRVEAMIEAGMI